MADRAGTRVIIVPMHALANSQLKELDKYVGKFDLPELLRPT